MTTTRDLTLNYYSKHSRTRQKKVIASLYQLLSEDQIGSKRPDEVCFKIVARQNSSARVMQKHSNPNYQSLRNLSTLNWLHQSERQQIQSHFQKSSFRNSQCSMTLSPKMISSKSGYLNPCLMQSLNHGTTSMGASEMANMFHPNQQIHSFYQDEDENNNQESVEIERVKVFPTITLDNNESKIQIPQQDPQNKYSISIEQKMESLQPLPPQTELSHVASSQPFGAISINQQREKPDKNSQFNSRLDEDDFVDAFPSPIEILQCQSHRQQPVSIENKNEEPPASPQNAVSNKYQILSKNSQNSPQVLTDKELEKEKNIPIEEMPKKSAKVNFKALMTKNKDLQNQNSQKHQFQFRKQRNKKLLLNFFDQN